MPKMEAEMVIGSGSHVYEVIDDWGNLPGGLSFGTTHGVVEDSQGRIYIHHTNSPSVFVFDADGAFIDAWGEAYAEHAHGMHLAREPDGEYLYLSATRHHFVAKTTLTGDEVFRIGTPDLPAMYDETRLFVPTETTVAPTGDIYITDGYGEHWVHQYRPDASYVRSFGGPGSEPGQINNPHGIEIDLRYDEPRLTVADRRNSRLQYFSLHGDHIGFLDHDLRLPCTAKYHDGETYVPDLHSRLTIFDSNDNLITHLGDWPRCWERDDWPNLPRSEWTSGKYSSPHDMHVDGSGNIYLVEWLPEIGGKITKLLRQ